MNDPLPPDWKWSTLGDVAAPNCRAIVSGPFGSNIGSRFFVHSGVPVIRGNNLTTDLTRFIDEGFVFVTEAKANELRNCEAIADDLVFTAAGSLGQIGIIPKRSKFSRYIISNKQLRARVDRNRIDPLFAFYWFSCKKMIGYIQQRNTGSSVPLINLSILRSLPLALPPLAEQELISQVLGALDDKITLNQGISETLEAMARALFKSWFVDFDPVRAKAEGKDAHLTQTVLELFPKRLVVSEIGEIPAGWQVSTLASVAQLNPESWSKETYPQEVLYLDLSNVKWGRIEEVSRFIGNEAPSRAQRVLRSGDTIVGTVRPGNGSYSLIHEDGLTGSTGFAVLRPIAAVWTEFVYLAATAPDNIEALSHLADGGAYPAVRPDVVASTPIARPDDRIVRAFSNVAGPLLNRVFACERESRTLAALRDALLPKLISGEIRIAPRT